jgi:hypothetical protein
MSSIQVLIDQKAALESEIARTLKDAEDRRKALEVQIAQQRAEEIKQGRAEINRVMQEYNLSPEEALGLANGPKQKKMGPGKRTGYLAEIRQYYSGRAA